MDIISRNDAILSQRKFYYTGHPCRFGHNTQRYTSNASCVECVRVYSAAWPEYLKFREREREEAKRAELLAAGDLGAWSKWELSLANTKLAQLNLEQGRSRKASRASHKRYTDWSARGSE